MSAEGKPISDRRRTAATPGSADAVLASLDAHKSAAAPHTGHETPAGAQAKAEAAQAAAQAAAEATAAADATSKANAAQAAAEATIQGAIAPTASTVSAFDLSALLFSNPPTQAECEALRDAIQTHLNTLATASNGHRTDFTNIKAA